MMLPMTESVLAPGVILRAVQTKKFKTSMLSVTFLEPLTADHASLNALLPKVLRRGTQRHPDMESLSAALDDLYGGGIEPILRKKGEVQCIGFWGSFLDDAFVPQKTHILEEATALLGELVLAPAGGKEGFLPAYVESEKENLLQKIRSQVNDKLQYALSRLRTQMCQGEAYGLDKLGTEAQVQAITGEALYDRYREILETAPVCFYYCGSADADRVERAFRKAFAGLPNTQRHAVPKTKVQMEPEGPVRRFHDNLDGFRTSPQLPKDCCSTPFSGGRRTPSFSSMSVRSSPCVILPIVPWHRTRDCSRYILGWNFPISKKRRKKFWRSCQHARREKSLRMSWRPPAGLWWEVCVLPWMPRGAWRNIG